MGEVDMNEIHRHQNWINFFISGEKKEDELFGVGLGIIKNRSLLPLNWTRSNTYSAVQLQSEQNINKIYQMTNDEIGMQPSCHTSESIFNESQQCYSSYLRSKTSPEMETLWNVTIFVRDEKEWLYFLFIFIKKELNARYGLRCHLQNHKHKFIISIYIGKSISSHHIHGIWMNFYSQLMWTVDIHITHAHIKSQSWILMDIMNRKERFSSIYTMMSSAFDWECDRKKTHWKNGVPLALCTLSFENGQIEFQ